MHCNLYEVIIGGIGFVIGVTENLLLVTTINYSAVSNSHTEVHCSTYWVLSLLSLLCLYHWPLLLTSYLFDCPLRTQLNSRFSGWLPSHTDLLLFSAELWHETLVNGAVSCYISAQTAQETPFLCFLTAENTISLLYFAGRSLAMAVV
jgi:hypothetical protein